MAKPSASLRERLSQATVANLAQQRSPLSLAKVALALAVLGSLLFGCGRGSGLGSLGGSSESLLHGKTPIATDNVRSADRLTDNVAATDGDFWNTDLSCVLNGPSASATFDFGREKSIDSVYLQGDNNDVYRLSVSADNRNFSPLWDAPPVGRPGLQTRTKSGLAAKGRYLRVTAAGGDGAYSLTELQVFEKTPAVFPPRPVLRSGVRPDIGIRSKILLFGLGLMVFVVATSRKTSPLWLGFVALLPILLGWDLYQTLANNWPVEARQVALIRGVAAAVAAVAILRELWAKASYRAHPFAVYSTLSVAAALALLSFANLGRPQFFNHKSNTPSFIHPFDMRVYYPVAKYFNELRFDGVYLASVLAYVEDQPGVTLDQLSAVDYRDLSNHQMVRVSEQRDQITAIKTRFTKERWEAFKVDMRYFREGMGPGDYLGSMHDHGGNATPVWLSMAYLLFAGTTANDFSLGMGALLDPALLALAFFFIGRTFGWRTSLVSMVIFGANDYYMFGTNWVGATLRHDWMAYLAFGACALKSKRYKTGGVFLAMASLIRAFPITSLLGAAIPTLWWAYEYYRREGRLFDWKTFRKEQEPLIQVAVSAVVCVALWVGFTSVLFGPQAWPEWMHKVHLLSKDPHVNHVSLKAAIAGSEYMQASTLAQRMPLYLAAVAFFSGLLLWIGKRRPMHQSAMLALILIPVLFYPANYYIHFIFLLPLAAIERRTATELAQGGPAETPFSSVDATIWLSVLGICMAQYFTTLVQDLDQHFYFASVLLFAGVTAFLVALAREPEADLALASAGPKELASTEPEAHEEAPNEDSEEDMAEESSKATPGSTLS